MKAGEFKITLDNVKGLMASIKSLSSKEVLVGIPADTANRKKLEGESITNASIGYINEFGSDLAGIPPRPHLIPGVRKVQNEISEEFKKAAQLKDTSNIEKYFIRAGIIASNSIKKIITDQEGFEELSFFTLLKREREGFKGDKALIRTGQYRNSITYVIEDK